MSHILIFVFICSKFYFYRAVVVWLWANCLTNLSLKYFLSIKYGINETIYLEHPTFLCVFFLIFSTSSNNLQNSTLCSVFGPPNYLYLTAPFQKAEGMESLSSVGRCFQFSFLSLSFCSSRVSALQKFRHTFPSLFICLHTPYIKYVCLQSFLKSS